MLNAPLLLTAALAATLAPATAFTTTPAAPSVAPVTAAAALQDGRPDLVIIAGRRDSEVPIAGTLVEARLDRVVIEVDGDEKSYDHTKVLRLQLNRLPVEFFDGRKHMKAARYAEAVESFTEAANSADRSPVQAAALLEAIGAEVAMSSTDPAAIGRALALANRFASEHGDHRDLPVARRWQARLSHVSGDTAAAIDGYAALLGELSGAEAAVGYDPILCLEAGLYGAHAALDAGANDRARDLFASLEEAATAVASARDADDPVAIQAEAVRERAQLGEGWILLVGGQGTQAETFFKSRAEGDQLSTAEARFEARMGLARSYEAAGKLRDAQVEYALVSATAFGARDLVARALLGLAATTLELGDTEARSKARLWLDELLARFPDTPSAGPGRELLASLGE